jgi:hypothetical protein
LYMFYTYLLKIVTHSDHIPLWFNAIYPFWPYMSLFDRCSKIFSWKQIAQRLDPRLPKTIRICVFLSQKRWLVCSTHALNYVLLQRFYDNFPYDSVKTTCKLHVKIFIRHSPVRRAYKYTVASLQSKYIDI